MDINTFDDEAMVVPPEGYFYLWCCDCALRHLVVIEACGKGSKDFKKSGGRIRVGFARDNVATDVIRKRDKIVLYKRNVDKKTK
jgi:hypothetical protein